MSRGLVSGGRSDEYEQRSRLQAITATDTQLGRAAPRPANIVVLYSAEVNASMRCAAIRSISLVLLPQKRDADACDYRLYD